MVSGSAFDYFAATDSHLRRQAKDFVGHAFLHDAATALYAIDGARFRPFTVEGKDAAKVRTMIAAFHNLAKLAKTEVPAGGRLTVKKTLNGPVDLAWKGHWLWGAVDDPAPARQPLIDELGRRLRVNPPGQERFVELAN